MDKHPPLTPPADRTGLSRRVCLQWLAGGTGLLLAGGSWAATNPPACVLTPEQTEGPYFVDGDLNRADLRRDPKTGQVSAGVPLQLQLQVQAVQGGQCAPLVGALVDIWHCDTSGIYSGVQDPHRDTTGTLFLRGQQVTDASGKVNFTTIYPGWYPGRAVHIHFKVRRKNPRGWVETLTSQLYFEDSITDQVYQQRPYQARPNRYPRNPDDGLFQDGGRQLVLHPTGNAQGYVASFVLGVAV